MNKINEFREVTGYKINIQKFAAFLHTNNKLSEREIKKIPFTNALKKKKLRNKFNRGGERPV